MPLPVPRSGFHGSSPVTSTVRSEEHTSELQSQSNLGCRLLPEKEKQGVLGGRAIIEESKLTDRKHRSAVVAQHLESAEPAPHYHITGHPADRTQHAHTELHLPP